MPRPNIDLLYSDSFDAYATANLAERYDAVNANLGTGGVAAGKGRRGTNAFWCDTPQGGSLTKRFGHDVNGSAAYLGGAWSFPGAPGFAAGGRLLSLIGTNHFGEVGDVFSLAVTGDGRLTLDLYGGAFAPNLWTSGPGVIRFGAGYRFLEIEALIDLNPVTKRYDLLHYALQIDGTDTLVTYGDDPTTEPPIALDVIYGWGAATWRAPGFVAMDDVYAGEGPPPGVAGGGFPGDLSWWRLMPNRPGDVTDFAPDAVSLAAGKANWETVDEVPPDDGDGVSSDAAGAHDRYGFEPLPMPDATPVFAVAVALRAAKTEPGPQKVGASVELAGAVDDTLGAQAIGDAPAVYQGVFDLDPSGAEWTVAGVNAMHAGPRLP